MPYDQTSLSVVYRLSKMLSGAIHFTGRNVCGTEGEELNGRPRLESVGHTRPETTYASFGDVVVVVHDVSRQPKVADLHYLALREQDVPGSQISMDTLQDETSARSY